MCNLLAGIILVGAYIEYGDCIQTKNFMANENRQGYGEELLIKTINKHFPEFDIHDRKALSDLLSTEKVQILLKNAAVKETKLKLESQQNRKYYDEPLDDRDYCNYNWLYWLPWLSCPEKTQHEPLVRFYSKTCY